MAHAHVCLFIHTVLCSEQVVLIRGTFHTFYTQYWWCRGGGELCHQDNQWIGVEHVAAEPPAAGMGEAPGAPGSQSVLVCSRLGCCSIGVTPLWRVLKRQIVDAWLLAR